MENQKQLELEKSLIKEVNEINRQLDIIKMRLVAVKIVMETLK